MPDKKRRPRNRKKPKQDPGPFVGANRSDFHSVNPKEIPAPVASPASIPMEDRTLEESGGRPPLAVRRITVNYVPEDDETFYATTNPCTMEQPPCGPLERKTFSYLEYLEYHRLLALKQKVLEPPSKLVPLLLDEHLLKMFYDRFGPIKTDHPSFSSLLRIMRETITEQDSTEDSKIEDKLLDLYIYPEDPIHVENRLKQLVAACQPLKYGNLNPLTSEGEWFVVPRPDYNWELGEFHYGGLSDHTSNLILNKVDSLRKHKILSSDPQLLVNLLVYDPKLDLGLNPPYLIQRAEEATEQDFPKLISRQIIMLINQYPYGIAEEVLATKLRQLYDPQVFNLGLHLIFQWHKEEFLTVNLEQGPCLFFPAVMEGNVTVEQMLKRYWHHVKHIVGVEMFLEVEKVIETLGKEHGIRFNPLDWGYLDLAQWFRYLIDKFDCEIGITVHQVQYLDLKENEEVNVIKQFLMLNSMLLRKWLSMHYRSNYFPEGQGYWKDERKDAEEKIPVGFMQQFKGIPSIAEKIRKNDKRLCTLNVVHNPEILGLVLLEQEKKWNTFTNALQ